MERGGSQGRLPIGANLDRVQKAHNAEKPLVAPLQGAGFGGGFYPGWRSAPAEPRLPWAVLGCRCPFGAPNGLNRREKLEFLPKKCVFQEIFLLWLTIQGQYCWQNQNHLMNLTAETSRFVF